LPKRLRRSLRERRQARAHQAISQGLIAVGAGDIPAATRFAAEAAKNAPDEPLTLLLRAQAAQLAGDRTTAERVFRAMAARSDTKLLGLRGLYIEAQRRDDGAQARHYAEEAAKAASSLSWAGQAVFEFRCASGDWGGALSTLERNLKGDLVDRAMYRRQRAVLLTAQALEVAESEPQRARSLVLEAVRLAPDLVPAAALAGRLLAEAGDIRRASRILEEAWRISPHPDLADMYAHLKSGASARERLSRVQALARLRDGHPESAFAIARAAVDAHEFALARTVLKPLLVAPTQRVAALMAEIEQAEHGDEGRAREWMARALRAPRDPAWTADGFVSDRWMPVSPITGRLDAFQWRVPLAELPEAGPVIYPRPIDEAVAGEESAGARTGGPSVRVSPSAEHRAPASGPAPAPAAVIPLAHAPDDPGPAPRAPDAERRNPSRLFFR
jgi:HemY protein